MHCVAPSWASVQVFIFCNSYAWVPQLSSVLKDGFQNHTVSVGKGFKYADDVGKPKNVQQLEDFSEEQQAELLRTNKGLMNNYHKI